MQRRQLGHRVSPQPHLSDHELNQVVVARGKVPGVSSSFGGEFICPVQTGSWLFWRKKKLLTKEMHMKKFFEICGSLEAFTVTDKML